MYCDLVRDMRASVKIPVAVKLGPYFSAMASLAQKLDKAGASGLVLFNRFYQPDFDLEKLEVTPNLVLSSSLELRLRLTWVGILCGRIKADMAITGGVHTATDVVKCMMAGAKAAMMTSALLKNGIEHMRGVLTGLSAWMEEKEYASVKQMQGSMSQQKVAQPAAFVRANYMKVLRSYALR
jgi:dihydroorotate dehydrogenase (fumarate)